MSQLVFITHETHNGRPSRSKKALIHAHTLQHNRRKGRAPQLVDRTISSGSGLDQAQPGEIAENHDLTTVLAASRGERRNHVTPPPPPCHPSSAVGITMIGPSGEDVQNIGQWYFHSQLDGVRNFHFGHAQTHWANGQWEMARVNQPVFAAIGAFALHKEYTLAGRPSNAAYLEQKGRTIWHISQDLSRPRPVSDPITMVAIALLGYMDLRDGNLVAASTHLRALRNLVKLSNMPIHAWLSCAYFDLRYALLTGQAPLLPHHIPPALQRDTSSRSPQDARTASMNVSHCPQATTFDHEIAFELFVKLHALCRLSNQLGASENPPFGQIYDLEYSLRSMQPRVSSKDPQDHNALAVELVVLAVQLHVWLACRFWTPQRRESHLAIVTRACDIVEAFEDIDTRWLDYGSAESLLWVLFTMVAIMPAHLGPHRARLLTVLRSVLSVLSIRRFGDFNKELAKWPRTEDWHPTQAEIVWTTVFEDFEVESANGQQAQSRITGRPPIRIESEERLFLGGLEFYNVS